MGKIFYIIFAFNRLVRRNRQVFRVEGVSLGEFVLNDAYGGGVGEDRTNFGGSFEEVGIDELALQRDNVDGLGEGAQGFRGPECDGGVIEHTGEEGLGGGGEDPDVDAERTRGGGEHFCELATAKDSDHRGAGGIRKII